MNKNTIAILCVIIVSFSFSAVSYAAGNIGDRCLRDGECDSGECKKYQCVTRVKPKGLVGDRCVFDGDCDSDECKKLRCVHNDYKPDRN
jgi:hypothetical protein